MRSPGQWRWSGPPNASSALLSIPANRYRDCQATKPPSTTRAVPEANRRSAVMVPAPTRHGETRSLLDVVVAVHDILAEQHKNSAEPGEQVHHQCHQEADGTDQVD